MTTPLIRKKRNFKGLNLDVTKSNESPNPPPSTQPEPVAIRMPPPAGGPGRKRPPPMNLAPKPQTEQPDDSNGIVMSTTPNSAPVTGSRPTYHNDLSQKIANMDLNAEKKYDLKNEDLKDLKELGQGNSGSVKKVEHIPSGKIMAKKASGHFPLWSSKVQGTAVTHCL